MLSFPIISEALARLLIQSGEAGYWELSPRGSLGKKPVAHGDQTCVFLERVWYLIPVAYFEVKALGRVGDENLSAAVHLIEVRDSELEEAVLRAVEAVKANSVKCPRCKKSDQVGSALTTEHPGVFLCRRCRHQFCA